MVKCSKLPSFLDWVASYKLSSSLFRRQKDWKKVFNQPSSKNINLYTQNISSRGKVLILPCILEWFDLHSLVFRLNQEGLNCSILIPESLFTTTEEITASLKILGEPTVIFAMSLSFNTCQSLPNPILAYNPISDPSLHFSSLPTHQDKSLLVSFRENHIYLKSSLLDFDSSFPRSLQELIPSSFPSPPLNSSSVFYQTSSSEDFSPCIWEGPSILFPRRELLISKLLTCLLKNYPLN